MKKEWPSLLKLILALIFAGVFWVQGTGWEETRCHAQQTIFQSFTRPLALPEFSLENLQQKMVDIRDHRGEVIFLNFWATW